MIIKVLGPGCMNCKTLERRAREAAEGLTPPPVIEKVEDYQQIASYGIMRTPGLVIDGQVVLSGTVPSVEALKALLVQHARPSESKA
jgi:small redox-active disulfide protein 2